LLAHSSAPDADEFIMQVDAYFICGDYFFLEALSAFEGRAPDFWGPERNGMLEQ
jgi:hypothetical protein